MERIKTFENFDQEKIDLAKERLKNKKQERKDKPFGKENIKFKSKKIWNKIKKFHNEDKVIKFSDYEPTKYNGASLVTSIMEWLRSYMLDNSDNEDYIRVPLSKFLDETNIDLNKLKTFIDEQEKTGRIESFKIKIEDDLIVFYEFKKDNSKKVWEENNK